jgi:hypothetical protein
MGRFSDVVNTAGVYVLFDLDDSALYVGKSAKLRDRLEQHFVKQDSSATADGLLDIYDVLRVTVWYAKPEAGMSVEACEAAAYEAFRPRWNRAVPAHAGPLPELSIENEDVVIGILDSPAKLAVRREPLERIEGKLLHLVRAVRKTKISGASPAVRHALARHADELAKLFGRLRE